MKVTARVIMTDRLRIDTVRRRLPAGVRIERDRGRAQVEVDAPPGYVAAGTGLHWIQYDCDPGDGSAPTYQEVLADVLDDWKEIERCEEINCDICRERNQA